jgi:protease-4
MKRCIAVSIIVISGYCAAVAQSTFTPYHDRNDFLLASPGALKFGLYGYDNPALLSYVRQPDILVTWNDGADPMHRWGLFAGVPNAGFSMVREKIGGTAVTDYRLSLAGGDRTLSAGAAYGWTITDNSLPDKSSLLILGTLYRPLPFISAGITYTSALNSKGYELTGDLAVHPLGNEKITVFADYNIHRTPQFEKNMWSAGVAVEALPGVRITGRYFDTDAFTLGAQLSLGRLGLETQAYYDANQHYAYNSYGVRLGAYDRNIIDSYFSEKNKFVEMNQPGQISYQRYILFDDSQTLEAISKMKK